MVMGPEGRSLFFRAVAPLPGWSHWTMVKSFSHSEKIGAMKLMWRPGPPCSQSRTGFFGSRPRMVIHCGTPPMSTNSPSSMARLGAGFATVVAGGGAAAIDNAAVTAIAGRFMGMREHLWPAAPASWRTIFQVLETLK